MKAILILPLGTLLTLAPSVAWSQPPLKYNNAQGAVTDIGGIVYDTVGAIQNTNGGYFYPCPPTVTYGQFDWNTNPPRYAGSDGQWLAVDTNPLNTGGRTETSSARADARGTARASVTGSASSPCIVFPNDAYYMGTYGHATAQFYRRFTVVEDPARIQVNLDWSFQGRFTNLTSGNGGGDAYLDIYLLTVPPSGPVQGSPSVYGALPMVNQWVNSRTWSGNISSCFPSSCKPLPTAPNINTSGTIDLRQAYQGATGRPMTAGDSFIIVALLKVWSRSCGHPDTCYPLLPAFSTDFNMSAVVRSDVVVSQ